MAGEWEETTLADISSDVSYGYTESATDEKVGPHFLRITDIQNGIVNWANVPYCPISAENHQKYRLEEGDIVVARTGNSTGENYLYQGDEDAVFASYLIRFRINRKKADPKFVWYNLRSRDWWNFINNSKTGSAQAGANAQILGRFPLSLPQIEEQRAIAYVLGTLDDKIELNRRMNETLEAMARALFKSWFVDFDPVRAKAEGRDPGLPKPLADLFPNSFEDSELGEIPKGWGVGEIEGLCQSITSGGTPARMNAAFWQGGTIPWFKTGELLDGPLLDSEEHITEGALTNSSCKLWPAGTILFALYAAPTVGRLGVLTKPGTSNQAAAGLIVKIEYGTPFLRRVLIEAREKFQSIAVGAAQQNINQGVLKSHRVVVPAQELAETYSRLMAPLDEQQVTIAQQTRTLAAMRDALLSKLVSGELRVNAAAARGQETPDQQRIAYR